MEWLDRMNNAMDYIEEHLGAEIDFNQVSKMACCSVFHFQRMFSFITDVPLSEYIRRRRLTKAAFELQSNHIKVIDVALKYGYDSPEAFTRAFKAMHGASPSQLRKNAVALKAYPRLSFQILIGGVAEMNYRIEQKEAFEVCGLTTEISVANEQNYVTIPQFWMDSTENGAVDRLKKDLGLNDDVCTNAALYNFREGIFSYMICVQSPTSGAPKDYATLSIPAQTWAIFPTPEHSMEESAEQIQKIWKRIFPEWFPTSGYEHADAPEFEMYYNNGNGKFISEVWIPIIKK